jgi:hypothetical protein
VITAGSTFILRVFADIKIIIDLLPEVACFLYLINPITDFSLWI